jgi:hypothetical protein
MRSLLINLPVFLKFIDNRDKYFETDALFVFTFFDCFLEGVKSQDIIFRNTSESPMYFLDTTFFVDHQDLKVVIGSLRKLRQNTIFFNHAFEITNSNIDSFYLKTYFFNT